MLIIFRSLRSCCSTPFQYTAQLKVTRTTFTIFAVSLSWRPVVPRFLLSAPLKRDITNYVIITSAARDLNISLIQQFSRISDFCIDGSLELYPLFYICVIPLIHIFSVLLLLLLLNLNYSLSNLRVLFYEIFSIFRSRLRIFYCRFKLHREDWIYF